MSDDRMVTFEELKEFFGIPWCRQHLWRLEKAHRFPLRKRLGNRRVVWRAGDIKAYVQQVFNPA